MANQLSALLEQWYPQREQCEWVLGTVYKTEGPCYRKAGAMMLFNSFGQQFGLLSGGCLESDIQTHARKVMQTGNSMTLCYDGSDEDDLSFQLGIGCGGRVHIMLSPVSEANDYQQLEQLYTALKNRTTVIYAQRIPEGNENTTSARIQTLQKSDPIQRQTSISNRSGHCWLESVIKPDPHILIVGGGVDARPVSAMAKQLGWQVSVWDPRPANARREYFMEADEILRDEVGNLPAYVQEKSVDMAVVMSHNIALDAAAIKALNGSGLSFMALLGPFSRKVKVLEQAQLSENELLQPVTGPAGLDIGGELPESIALSILSECHLMLNQKALRQQKGKAA